MDAFENKIYPTDREFFGSEWTPGVDDDPHIYILYTSGLGANVGGYFYSPDEYPRRFASTPMPMRCSISVRQSPSRLPTHTVLWRMSFNT